MKRQFSHTERTFRQNVIASAIERATVVLSRRPTSTLKLKPVPSLHRFGEGTMLETTPGKSSSNFSDAGRLPKIYIGEQGYSQTNFDLKYKPNDDADILDRYPSYRRFHVPYDIIALDRYSRKKAKYDEQFRREIQYLIDFQSTAIEASYFVRAMAYTTLWPPLHTQHELDYTSNNLFQLSPKEKRRLDYIMTHEFT